MVVKLKNPWNSTINSEDKEFNKVVDKIYKVSRAKKKTSNSCVRGCV